MNLTIYNFGCKVNQYEGQRIRECAESLGFHLKDESQESEYVIINSCAVTHKAEKDILKLLRKVAKSNVILTGCYTDEFSTKVIKGYPNVKFVPQAQKNEIFKCWGYNVTLPQHINSFHRHSRAFVKVQDGCNSFCSYCIVPFIRNRIYSRPQEEILDEISGLYENGYREFVLTGIRLGLYEFGLPNLIASIISSFPDIKLRLSSIQLNEVTDELLEMFRFHNLIKHLHIPLQSGSDRILKLMNRRYTSNEYVDRIRYIKSRYEDIAITTDIIVGFPTEDDTSFIDTIKVVEACKFAKLHIFPYSARPMTKAAEITDNLSTEKKLLYIVVLHEINSKLQKESNYTSLLGTNYSRFMAQYHRCRNGGERWS